MTCSIILHKTLQVYIGIQEILENGGGDDKNDGDDNKTKQQGVMERHLIVLNYILKRDLFHPGRVA